MRVRSLKRGPRDLARANVGGRRAFLEERTCRLKGNHRGLLPAEEEGGLTVGYEKVRDGEKFYRTHP